MLIAFFLSRQLRRFTPDILLLDAAGLSLFCVTGATKSLEHGPGQAVILGAVTAVGGVTIRDILVRRVPTFLTSGLYAIHPLQHRRAHRTRGQEQGVSTPDIPVRAVPKSRLPGRRARASRDRRSPTLPIWREFLPVGVAVRAGFEPGESTVARISPIKCRRKPRCRIGVGDDVAIEAGERDGGKLSSS